MKVTERASMWHHVVFSGVLCMVLLAVIIVHHDAPGLLVGACIAAYIAGNSLIHYRRKDFRNETFLEYLLVSVAVLIVLFGAIRH